MKARTGLSLPAFQTRAVFFAQGESHEEAQANLEDVIEGNVLLALQLGWDIPAVEGVSIEERDLEARSAR